MTVKRKSYNTTLRADLTRRLRILAAQEGKRQNDLLEEAIQDLLNKYGKDTQAATSTSVAKQKGARVPELKSHGL